MTQCMIFVLILIANIHNHCFKIYLSNNGRAHVDKPKQKPKKIIMIADYNNGIESIVIDKNGFGTQKNKPKINETSDAMINQKETTYGTLQLSNFNQMNVKLIFSYICAFNRIEI